MDFLVYKYHTIFFLIFFISKQLKGCPVYLTVSLEERTWLQINYGPNCDNEPEMIKLYPKDPSFSFNNNSDNLKHDFIFYPIGPWGFIITDFLFDNNLKFPGGWNKWEYNKHNEIIKYPKGKCLNYYLGVFYKNDNNNNDDMKKYDMSVNCLKIQPNWMTLTDHISKVQLKDLFIPGTHSSGAYPPGSQTRSILVKNFGYAQNFDVWSQLVFGIRFLDFKIGYRRNLSNNNTTKTTIQDGNTNFWIVNENMFINPLKPILNDIKEFLLLSGEIVIMDFSDFPIGFSNTPKRHTEFLEYLQDELEFLTYDRSDAPTGLNSYELTVDDIRAKGKNLIILYPVEELTSADVVEFDFVWPSWKRFTVANLNSDETLDFMKLLFTKKESSPIQDEGWIFHGIQSLEESYSPDRNLLTSKQRAGPVNRKITRWLSGPWSLKANVIVVDYFMSTNIIDMAIQVNTHKGFTIVNKNLTRIEM